MVHFLNQDNLTVILPRPILNRGHLNRLSIFNLVNFEVGENQSIGEIKYVVYF